MVMSIVRVRIDRATSVAAFRRSRITVFAYDVFSHERSHPPMAFKAEGFSAVR